jgi:hypothetical protein
MCGEMCDENDLKSGIQEIGFCTMSVHLFTALSEPDFLPRNKMTVVTCPLYSFNLVPYDFLFFPELRVALKGR